MLPMTKVMVNGSYFKLVAGNQLKDFEVIQIYPKKVYTNVEGYAVFLCEVADKESEDK